METKMDKLTFDAVVMFLNRKYSGDDVLFEDTSALEIKDTEWFWFNGTHTQGCSDRQYVNVHLSKKDLDFIKSVIPWPELTPMSLVRASPYYKDHPKLKDKIFVFLGEIPNMEQHGVFLNIETGEILSCYHLADFEEIPEHET